MDKRKKINSRLTHSSIKAPESCGSSKSDFLPFRTGDSAGASSMGNEAFTKSRNIKDVNSGNLTLYLLHNKCGIGALEERVEVDAVLNISDQIGMRKDEFSILKFRCFFSPNPLSLVVRTVSKRELERASEVRSRESSMIDVVCGSAELGGIVDLSTESTLNPKVD